MEKIYYVGKKAQEMYPELPYGAQMFRAEKQSDVYRVLSPGQSFFKLKNGLDNDEFLGYGLSGFDLESVDPHSREVLGPWEHTGHIKAGFDKLPGTEGYRLTHCKDGVEMYTSLCIDPDFRKQLTDAEYEVFLDGIKRQVYFDILGVDEYIIVNDDVKLVFAE